MIKLAAFLGNPGAEYKRNRHNAGRMLAQALPFYQSISWQKKFKGLYSSLPIDMISQYTPEPAPGNMPASCKETDTPELPDKIHFLMPETFMNLSGESVFAAASFLKIKPEETIVIHDELEIPLGFISLKFSGGLGGHNGLRSMRACFATADFWRLRIGIGRPDSRLPGEGGPPGSGRGIAEWVLSDFYGKELELFNPALEAAAALFIRSLLCQPQTLLGKWSKVKITKEA
jgi:PTH1 family peptidyl-tRNA hydrolase